MLFNIINNMNKRGNLGLVGAIFFVGILIFGGIASYNIISENRYIGDKSTSLYYDLKKCDVRLILSENIINFNSLEEAENNGYKPANCSLQ